MTKKTHVGGYDLEYAADCNPPSGIARFTVKSQGMHVSFYGTEIDEVKKFLDGVLE